MLLKRNIVVRDKALQRVVEAKGGLQLRDEMDEYLDHIEHGIIPDEPFEPVDGIVLPADILRQWFDEDYARYPLGERVSRVLARVKRWLEMELKAGEMGDPKAAKRKATARFKSFEKLWPKLSPLTVYRDFLDAHPKFRSDTIHKPNHRHARYEVQAEDLAPLLYIHLTLFGVDARDRFDHVVIDEAQDFSPLQLAVLKAYCQSGAFTILGDVSQSIHTYQGITNWSRFTDQFEAHEMAYFELDVSYRSTLEIIEFANRVVRPFSTYREAKPVFRSGEDVALEQVNAQNKFERAVDMLQQLGQHSNTVALLTRTQDDADAYYNACLEAGLDAHLIEFAQSQYLGGMSVLPVYLAKGLEFDAVLIVDVDSQHYDDTALSAKLLYVGCTRALHRLRIHYSNDISPLLTRVDATP